MCVFTDKKYIKRATYVLVPLLAINTFVGCSIVDNTTKIEDNDIGIVISDTIYIQEDVNLIDNVELPLKGNVFERLRNVYSSCGRSYQDILSNRDSENEEILASALYAKLKDCSLNDEDILVCLENIICFGTQATCVDEDTWFQLFGTFLPTISEYDNVVDYYYPLSSYIHKYNCNLEHSSLFFDEKRITCSLIEEMLNEKCPPFDYVNYIKEMVYATNDETLISKYNRLSSSGVDMEYLINELENIYMVSSTPISVSDEIWMMLFGNIVNTVPDNINVCEYYYDLSYYVHSLWCDLEHSTNEYGKYECDDYTLLLEK